MMKFELLPKEIFIECFDYLDALDIFYSFNQFNDLLNELIRNIPLNINFQYVRKAKFSQFCRQISSDREILQHISSLHLSNKDTCGQIKAFLSLFPLNKYPHLHSLTLTHVEKSLCNFANMAFRQRYIRQWRMSGRYLSIGEKLVDIRQ